MDAVEQSAFSSVASGQDVGELFEYSFASPVTVKMGESAMLPFLQQKVGARKLLIYSESMGLHPMNAAEVSNSTGKTLDGGPITVYDAGAYAGEALVETLKAGDKRLISYGVDLGMRLSTAWDTSRDAVREIHLRRGTLTTRNATQETKTYTIKNVDAQPKTLVIEHAERPGYKLLNQTPSEKTSNAYRFEVKVPASAEQTFAVEEERVYDQTISLNNAAPDVLATWLQNKALSDAGRRQLEQIAQKKNDVASNDAALAQVQADRTAQTQDQERAAPEHPEPAAGYRPAGSGAAVRPPARRCGGETGRAAGQRERSAQEESPASVGSEHADRKGRLLTSIFPDHVREACGARTRAWPRPTFADARFRHDVAAHNARWRVTGRGAALLLPESREAPLLARHEINRVAPDVRASVPLRLDSSPISLRTSGSGAERRAYSWMLIRTARGMLRFSITSERRSSSTRRSNLPKLARARSAETIMEQSLSLCSKMNSLFQLSEPYS